MMSSSAKALHEGIAYLSSISSHTVEVARSEYFEENINLYLSDCPSYDFTEQDVSFMTSLGFTHCGHVDVEKKTFNGIYNEEYEYTFFTLYVM